MFASKVLPLVGEAAGQAVHFDDATGGGGQGIPHLVAARYGLPPRRRIVHPGHVDGHGVRGGAVRRSVVDLDLEARVAVRVCGRAVLELVGVQLGLGDRLGQVARSNRGAVQLQRALARRGQLGDLHVHQRIAGVRVREGEVGRAERDLRALVRRHGAVRVRGGNADTAGRGGGGGVGGGTDADSVYGRDAVVAGGAGGEAGVGVGRGDAAGGCHEDGPRGGAGCSRRR